MYGRHDSPLLQNLVHEDDCHPHQKQLADDEYGVSGAKGRQGSVHAGHHEGDGLDEGQENGHQLEEEVRGKARNRTMCKRGKGAQRGNGKARLQMNNEDLGFGMGDR